MSGPLIVSPTALGADNPGELVIGDGLREVDLMGVPPHGLYLVELVAPLPLLENSYAQGVDANGQRRVRSLSRNGEGSALVRVDRMDSTPEAFVAGVDDLEDIVAAAHKFKGYIRYTWPNGREVTYRLESCALTEVPQDGIRLNRGLLEATITFECKPWGELPEQTVFTGQAFNGPIAGIEIDDIPGHYPALAELELTEVNGSDADHVEYGVIQEGYVAAAPLQISAGDLITTGFVGAAGIPIDADLSPSVVAVCGTGEQLHRGRHVVRVTVEGSADDDENVWVRLAYRRQAGRLSYGTWAAVPVGDGEFSVPLAAIDLGDSSSWEGQIEAYAESGQATLAIVRLDIIPAEVHGAVRYPPRIEAGTAYGARDAFLGSGGGALTGRSASVGGTWTAAASFIIIPEGGDPDESGFGTGAYVKRSTASADAAPVLARLPVDVAALSASAKIGWDDASNVVSGQTIGVGVVARYVNSTNYAAAILSASGLGDDRERVRMRIELAGTVTFYSALYSLNDKGDMTRNLTLDIAGDGRWAVYIGGNRKLSGQSTALATGGALDSGQVGLFSFHDAGAATLETRWSDFRVITQPEDHALWANQRLRITSEGAQREEEVGSTFGDALVDGDYLTIPPSTGAARTSLLVVKRRQFDIDEGLREAQSTNDVTGTLTVTPRVMLF